MVWFRNSKQSSNIKSWELYSSRRILVNQATVEEKRLNYICSECTKTVHDGYYDEELEQDIPPVYEEQLIETKQEVKLVPTLKFLMLMIGSKVFKTIFEMFTLQYVSDIKADNPDFFKELK